MNKNKKNGFTLVELLAVIVILAIILVIAVPKVMSVIDDAKKATLESTAKMIASAAEKAKVQNTVLNKNEEIDCEDVVKLNNVDYERCIIEFDDDTTKVSIKGSGKFEGLYICEGDKTNAAATDISCSVEYGNGATYINKLQAFKASDNGLIIDDTADKNIRYAGSNPNNKVYFNCKNKDSNNVEYGNENYDYANSCEIWRIIGVFDVDNGSGNVEKRVKLIRDILPIKMSWDSTFKEINTGNGINQWGPSTYEDGSIYDGADLMLMLNGYYIGEEPECNYCNLYYQGICENVCTDSINPLSNISLSMIGDVLWNLGAVTFSDTIPLSTMYEGERSTQIGKICSSTTVETDGKYYCTDTVKRTIEWVGKVGLIYPSDWGYASSDASCSNDIFGEDSTCENSNWLHANDGNYWTISPIAYNVRSAFVCGIESRKTGKASAMYYNYYARPSLYLKTSIKITEGNGTNEMPYILK